jgi:hypothetical protein
MDKESTGVYSAANYQFIHDGSFIDGFPLGIVSSWMLIHTNKIKMGENSSEW